MSTIKVDDLTSTIMKTLEDYIGVTEDAVAKGVIDTANECVKQLQQANPAGSGHYGSWQKYNMGWERTKVKANGKGGYTEVVHNRKRYQLTHLLEHGHAIRGGGRARAFPHIAPVAEAAEKTLLDNIKRNIK